MVRAVSYRHPAYQLATDCVIAPSASQEEAADQEGELDASSVDVPLRSGTRLTIALPRTLDSQLSAQGMSFALVVPTSYLSRPDVVCRSPVGL